MKRNASENRPLLLYLCALFLCMFVLSSMTPLVSDDYNYAYSFLDFTRITKISQIFSSMAAHRIRPNGRVFAHGLLQLFMMGPKVFFNLCNAANAVLLAWLFSCYFPHRRGARLVLLLAAGAMIIWNFSPAFGEDFLWMDGALNYAWSLSALLLFLWPFAAEYLELPYKRKPLDWLLFCVIAFVAGSYSENGSVSMLFAAFCLLLLVVIRQKKLPPFLLAGFLMAVLGFVWLMSAPGTAHRGAGITLSVLGTNYLHVLNTARARLLPLYLIYAALLAAAIACKGDRRRLILSGILILAGLASLASFVFAAYFELRHFCFTVITAALACLLPLSELLDTPQRLLAHICVAAMSVLFLFNAAAGAMDIAVGCSKWHIRQARIRQAQEAGASAVVLDEYLCSSPYGISFKLNDFGPDWPNMWIAQYHGFDVVYKTGTEPQE